MSFFRSFLLFIIPIGNFAHREHSSLVMMSSISDLTTLPYDECLILNPLDGVDVQTCDCPPGFVLCSHEEVQHRIDAGVNMWAFASELCDREKYPEGSVIFVDYNHHIQCEIHSNADKPKIEFVEHVLRDTAIPKGMYECYATQRFLCKRVFGKDRRDCKFGPWADWTVCNEKGLRKRRREVLSSGQHGGTECMWNNEPLDENRVVQTETCIPPS
eukprot:GHVN01009168.1.p1 GENE.GHVN01009168.1~~GHVN01009168.1.p1  ORF type:complete len:215 (-),score=8.50 GHVN01009168.1:110-754(-)